MGYENIEIEIDNVLEDLPATGLARTAPGLACSATFVPPTKRLRAHRQRRLSNSFSAIAAICPTGWQGPSRRFRPNYVWSCAAHIGSDRAIWVVM